MENIKNDSEAWVSVYCRSVSPQMEMLQDIRDEISYSASCENHVSDPLCYEWLRMEMSGKDFGAIKKKILVI